MVPSTLGNKKKANALICGNSLVWKGAPSTNLTSIAVTKVLADALEAADQDPALCSLVAGGAEIGEQMTNDTRIPLVISK